MNMQDAALRHIMVRTAEAFKVDLGLMAADVRSVEMTQARFAGQWLARDLTGAPVMRIASTFKRDHASVINGIDRAEEWMLADRRYRNKVMALRDSIEVDLRRAETAFVAAMTEITYQRLVAPEASQTAAEGALSIG